ncbi:WG repeat-containing protein [Pseudoprevotella muciniphila]|uniref:WG repeat-containing protein n=1 Tax=Pseudoprevotella muciniphila TaxID=2133944 RepID=A0A5P8E7I8_9BACT|nr:WG repeat-containing protein [Pseudoprevotella muciniphila]QFQ12850.1 WG repeat-containing protein [Pseudoprevotella muciniphila]
MKFSFKTLKGIYLLRLPNFRSKFRKRIHGTQLDKVNSYLIYNANDKTSKIIDYEEVWASTFDSNFEWFIINENEKFIVAENGKCFHMDTTGTISPYIGDIHSMRSKKINIIPKKKKKKKDNTLAPLNRIETDSIPFFEKGGNKLCYTLGKTIELPFKIWESFDDLILIYKDIIANKKSFPIRKYGIANKNGEIIVEPIFDNINYKIFESKKEKLYLVELDEKYGLINGNGKEVLPTKYKGIEDYDERVAIVDNGTKLINIRTGKVLYTCDLFQMDKITKGWIAVSNKGLLDTNGVFFPISLKKVENLNRSDDFLTFKWGENYDIIGSKVCDGLIPVYDSHRGYGYVNINSVEVIKCKYNEINYFSNGRARVRYDTEFGYIDTKGNIIVTKGKDEILIPNKYDWAYNFCGNVSVVQQGTRFGLVDYNLNELLPCVFYSPNDVIKSYKKVLLSNSKKYNQECLIELEPPEPFKENGLYGFKRIDGKILCPPIFRCAHCFIEGRALVSIGNKYGFLNENLEFSIPPIYYSAEDFSEGLALVNNRDYINKEGECIIHTSHNIERLSSFFGGTVNCDYNYCQPGRDNETYEITKRVLGF